jgi:hypothetical protein
VTVFTFKKLSDSFVFIDDKDLIIDDWLSIMRNKIEDNADWFLQTFNRKHTCESKLMMMLWSI